MIKLIGGVGECCVKWKLAFLLTIKTNVNDKTDVHERPKKWKVGLKGRPV